MNKYKIFRMLTLIFLFLVSGEIILLSLQSKVFSYPIFRISVWGLLVAAYLTILTLPFISMTPRIRKALKILIISLLLLLIFEICIYPIDREKHSETLYFLAFWGLFLTISLYVHLNSVNFKFFPLTKEYVSEIIGNVLDERKMTEKEIIHQVYHRILAENNRYVLPGAISDLLYEMEGEKICEENGFWRKI